MNNRRFRSLSNDSRFKNLEEKILLMYDQKNHHEIKSQLKYLVDSGQVKLTWQYSLISKPDGEYGVKIFPLQSTIVCSGTLKQN